MSDFSKQPPSATDTAAAPAPAHSVHSAEKLRDDEERATNAAAVINAPDDGSDPNGAGESATSDLPEWKDELRRDFEVWLASIDEIPEAEAASTDEFDEVPDLYSFYAQQAAAYVESRKANRRTAEAISQWGETLARFESGLQPLRDTAAQLAASRPKEGRMSREHCLMLVELLDRMHRLARAFESPPAAKGIRRVFGGGDAWRQTWEAQHRALDILVGHLEGLLRKEGVSRIDTVGQPFDPALMMAVAADPDASLPPNSVLEEMVAGYCRDGTLLRAAHVEVASRRAGESDR